MQLSASVLPADPSPIASVVPGLPVTANPTTAANDDGKPSSFDDLLAPTSAKTSSKPGKSGHAHAEKSSGAHKKGDAKTADAAATPSSTSTNNDPAVPLWASWFAAATPASTPVTPDADLTGGDGLTVVTGATKSVVGLDIALTGEGGGVPAAASAVAAAAPTGQAGLTDSFVAPDPTAALSTAGKVAMAASSPVQPLSTQAPVAPGDAAKPLPTLPLDSTAPTAAAIPSAENETAAAAMLKSATAPAVAEVAATVVNDPAVSTAPVAKDASRAPAKASGPSARSSPSNSSPISTGEKFADTTAKNVPTAISAVSGADKKILTPENKDVTEHDSSLGIDAASVAPAMSTTASSAHAAVPTLAPVQASVTSSAPMAAPAPAPSSSPVNLPALAHQAVEAVMTAADRVSEGIRSAVHLQFAVGDAALSVHVEMRAGEVHATFRTDSSELRSALATEWQSMSNEASRRLADPVFAPVTSGHGAAFSGDGATSQRDSGQRQQAERHESGFSFSNALKSSSAPAETASPAADYRPAYRPNLNLHTFA